LSSKSIEYLASNAFERTQNTTPSSRSLFVIEYSSVFFARYQERSLVLGGKKFKIEISSFVKNNISDTNEREPLNHHLAKRTTVCFVVVLFLRLNNPLVIRLISGEISRKEFKIGQLSLSDY